MNQLNLNQNLNNNQTLTWKCTLCNFINTVQSNSQNIEVSYGLIIGLGECNGDCPKIKSYQSTKITDFLKKKTKRALSLNSTSSEHININDLNTFEPIETLDYNEVNDIEQENNIKEEEVEIYDL